MLFYLLTKRVRLVTLGFYFINYEVIMEYHQRYLTQKQNL